MNTLLRLLIAVMLSGCASYGDAVSAREKKEAEFVVLGASRFAIYKDHVLHAITQNEWGKRNELGIPSDARKCDGPYYVYFKVTDGERGTVIGLVTEDNRKKLSAVEPLMYFSETIIEKTRLFSGVYLRNGQRAPFANYLFIPPQEYAKLTECATREELNT